MLFDKTIKIKKQIRDLKNAEKKRIKKQQQEMKDIVPFESKISQTANIYDMLINNIEDLDYIKVKVDDNSETLLNEYVYTLLQDFIVKKEDDVNKLFSIKQKSIEF